MTAACLAGTAALVAAPTKPRPVPKPLVRVGVEHRTVVKHLPRRTKVKRVYVNAPAPAPPRPVAAPAARPAYRAQAPAPAARPAPSPSPAARPIRAPTAAPAPHHTAPAPAPPANNAAAVHQWEEIHHQDAPNHDQAEHSGRPDD
jgi:hypothetical protein